MGLALRYTVDGEQEVTHKLLRMGDRALEPEPVLELIADQLRAIEKKRFDDEGPGWAPLAASTVERKGSSQIGQETEAMMNSLTKKGAPGSISLVMGNTLHFGTNLLSEDDSYPYPVGFDEGNRDGAQPARPLFDIQPQHYRLFTKAVQTWIVGVGIADGFSPRGSDPVPGVNSLQFAGF